MGWKQFKPLIIDCLKHLNATEFIEKIERYSLKYVNVIAADSKPEKQFSKIHFNGNPGNSNLAEEVTSLRTEIQHKELLNIVSIATGVNVEIQPSQEKIFGLLLDIDAIQVTVPQDFWENAGQHIVIVHEAVTDIFFGTVTQEALAKYGYTDE